ncbi:MAG: hypothetical protein KF870_06330 [Leadbetterella sp.]|nr:hypothetical protein [Leadbetterella sp.]
MESNKVVLADKNDNATAVMDKLAAHQQGRLHRVFSVFIFDDQGSVPFAEARRG